MNRQKALNTLVLLPCLLAGCGGGGSDNGGPPKATHYQYLFVRLVGGAGEILVAYDDGSSLLNLTNRAANDLSPAFPSSKPGSSVFAFSSDHSGNFEIYLGDLTGGGVFTKLTDSAGSSSTIPAFNKDGTRLVYMSDRSGNNEIWSVSSQGGAEQQLTNDLGQDTDPCYQPDGRVLFCSDRGGNSMDLYRMDANGANTVRLTNTDSDDESSPSVSPSGNLIVYTVLSAQGEHIWTMKPDGTAQTQITFAGDNRWPRFTQDGTKILFESTRNGKRGVYMVNVNGTNEAKITLSSSEELQPSPVGKSQY